MLTKRKICRLVMVKWGSVFVPAAVGTAIAWLGAALTFLAGYREDLFTVFIALTLLYAVVGWELRGRADLRLRLPIAIFGGGVFAGALCPAVMIRFDFQQADIWWLLNPVGPLDVVIFALIGALFFLMLVAIASPMKGTVGKKTT